jgi:ElaB/YqjD/DUF883 family membrane-anchored ribosome-binding protein
LGIVKPLFGNDAAEARIANYKIKAFNRAVDDYNACIRDYVDKANGDMAAIKDRANADLKRTSDRANASMTLVEDKIAQALAQVKAIADAQQHAMDTAHK